MTITFCDLGIGIPKALPRKHKLEKLREFISKLNLPAVNDHARMIKAAMEIGRSQTGKAYRGKGLPGMKEIINANAHSSMRIYSLEGMYEYSHGNAERLESLDGKIPGIPAPIPIVLKILVVLIFAVYLLDNMGFSSGHLLR